MDNDIYGEILDNILALYDKLKDKKVIIFGAGKSGKIAGYILNTLLITVSYYVDNDSNKWNTNIFNNTIYNPKKILEENTNPNTVILIASVFAKDILQQLMKFDVKNNIFSLIEQKELLPLYFEKRTYLKEYDFFVGKYTYGYNQFCYEGVGLKDIGAFTSVAKNVMLADVNHPTNYITTSPIIYLAGFNFMEKDRLDRLDYKKNEKVVIGNDVWIGAGVKILPSVTINNGAIIGTGAVVTKDVPSYSIVVGCPAKVIKYRFTKEEIDILNKSEWWNWDDEKIKDKFNLFYDNIKFFDYIKRNY